MLVRLGYAAMSRYLKNASPSQTMTFTQFEKIPNREAAIQKLERIAISNLENCLRLLKHNRGHDVSFFRFSSKLIPLANHESLLSWNYLAPLRENLRELGAYIAENKMRVDFHPDHFVILNASNEGILKQSLKTLQMHKMLLKGMRVSPVHRCVLHVGGAYKDKERALEQFIENWGQIPVDVQSMMMLENDDTTFTIEDALYIGEKLAVPVVFDYHHDSINHESDWRSQWSRVVDTWSQSPLPVKIHMSSPRDEKDKRAHADYIETDVLLKVLQEMKGSVPQIDCMIEAKKTDEALFRFMHAIKNRNEVEIIDGASFYIK